MMLKQCKKNQSMVFQAPFVYEMSSAKSASQLLAKYVNQIQPNKYNQTNEKRIHGGKNYAQQFGNIKRRYDDFRVDEESMKSILKGFKVLAVDPIGAFLYGYV